LDNLRRAPGVGRPRPTDLEQHPAARALILRGCWLGHVPDCALARR
jgi:hypothetical protein